MNLDWYNVFYVTAKAENISRASQELFITQPAVSHTIKQLEHKLGVILFFRTSKGVKLTPEGQALYTYVEQARNLLELGEGKLNEMRQLDAGEIRIGASDTICKHFLLPFIKDFHDRYPSINLQVTNRTSDETLELLHRHQIDFGLVHSPVQDNRFQYRRSMQIQDCFVAGEAYKHLAEKPMTLQQLTSQPLLLLESHSASRRYLDRFAAQSGVTLHPSIELGSFDLLVQFAQIGLGISGIIRNYAEEEIRQGKLFEIPLIEPIPERYIYIAIHPHFPSSAAVRRFLEFLP